MSVTFFLGQDIIEIGQEQLDQLKLSARESPLKRARLCLHQDHQDKVQEMVIAFCQGSFNRPHRHTNKTESFHVIEGELMVVFFDDSGHVLRRIRMSPYGGDQTFLYRLASSMWHTVVPLTEFVIIHETSTGPFLKEETEYPAWGPSETDTEGIEAFMAKITA